MSCTRRNFTSRVWHKYWDYAFLNSPIFCGICLAGILLFLVTKREWPDLADDGIVSPLFQPQKHANCQLVLYSLAFVLLLNLVVALLDAAGVIPIYLMLAVRYVLVAAVAYGVIFSAILERLNRMVRHYSKPQWAATLSRAQCVLITALLLFGVDKMWSTWFLDKSARESYYHRVAELAREKHLDVLCESHMNAFFLTTRTSAAEVKYLLEDNFPFRTLLLQIHKFYPRPTPLSRTEFLHCTNDVVLVPFNGEVVIFKARTLGAP